MHAQAGIERADLRRDGLDAALELLVAQIAADLRGIHDLHNDDLKMSAGAARPHLSRRRFLSFSSAAPSGVTG